MGRTRYKIYEPTHPHFVTCTILHWLPIYTRKESVQIIIYCIKFLQEKYWRYSSARDYEGIKGLVEVERFW